jgi:glycosyltransferase involved in cell wall biosynthesis
MRIAVTAHLDEPGSRAVHARAAAAALEAAGHEVVLAGGTVPGVARAVARADVVYDVGALGAATVVAGILHRPLVVKLAGDPALARGRRLRLHLHAAPDDEDGGAPAPARLARRIFLRRATRVACASPWAAERIRGWGLPDAAIDVVPTAAPTIPAFGPREELRRSFGFGDGPVLVHAGRLVPARRLERLIDALGVSTRPELVFAGTGPDGARLSDLAAARGIAARVHMVGTLPHARLLELFHAADLAVQPAVPGVFPNATLEALAVGRPVLTTLAAGSPELVRDGENGLVVDPPDPGALAAAIDRFLDDAQLRDRLERSASVGALAYAPERIYAQLEALLAAAAAEPA